MSKKRKDNYEFWIPIAGSGATAQEAWEDAVGRIAAKGTDFMAMPADIFSGDESIPSAEILGGSLHLGFGIKEV